MVLCGVIAFVPLIGTLYNLMITQHDYYNEKAIKNQTRSTNLTAARGVIYDANMNVLASSSTVETVFIDPNEIAEQMKSPRTATCSTRSRVPWRNSGCRAELRLRAGRRQAVPL